jgi:hypothetical protein
MNKLSDINFRYLVFLLILNPYLLYSQGVGISDTNIVADPSSILELRSSTQGVLVPRLTTIERDAIVAPADGLLIFNISTSDFNFYKTGWQVIAVNSGSGYNAIDAGSTLTTTSTTDVTVTGMTLAPDPGTYVVDFNSQCDIPAATTTTGYSTATGKADLNLIYTDITSIPITNSTHTDAFGSGETLTPGVYTLPGAISLAGSITLDGGGDSNAVFVIRSSGGAFAAGAGVIVNLTNGTRSSNVYWVAEGALSVGAGSIFYGSLLSNTAAVGVGANCTITGRLLTKSGAIAFGPGTLSVPTDPSVIDFRSLTNFVMFTGLGGITNTGGSIYTGDIATDGGAITGFSDATVNGIVYQPGATTTVTQINHEATFSLYKNGVLIANSSRTLSNPAVIYLQAIATVAAGETIDVRWKMDGQTSDNGLISVGNRILSTTRVQ